MEDHSSLITPRHRQELRDKGYTVVEGVLSPELCDTAVQQHRDWITNNFPPGTFPTTKKSLVRSSYRLGHSSTSWMVRLACKQAYTDLWGTEKLLTSFDSVVIGRPPEQSEEQFRSRETSWLHIDQIAGEQGLSVCQGAVYLEDADEDDWTFEVLEGSHKYFEDYWRDHPEEHEQSVTQGIGSSKFTSEIIDWWRRKGCQSRYVAVPKGGLVLWDSKTVHANANPVQGRNHPDRWRWVQIVSMWPVRMASPQGLESRRQAYLSMTQTCYDLRVKAVEELQVTPKRPLTELPENARSLEARRLAGVEPYHDEEQTTQNSLEEIRSVFQMRKSQSS